MLLLPCGDVFADVSDYAVLVVWMEPRCAAIVLEPRHLFFCIDAGVFLHSLYCHGQLPCAVEDVEHLFVADGVQCIFVAVGQECHGFVE